MYTEKRQKICDFETGEDMPIYFTSYPNNLPFSLESVGNRWEQENVWRPRGYPSYHWLQTEEGCGSILVNRERVSLPKGKGIFIKPFVPHSYFRKTEVWKTSFATFFGTLEADIDKITGGGPVICVEPEAGNALQSWVDAMVERYEGRNPEPMEVSTQCYAFFLCLSQQREGLQLCDQAAYSQYVAPTIREIETGFEGRLTVEELAGSVYVTPQYLSRLFRRFFGCSVYEYLTNYRMGKAKELLIGSPRLEVQHVEARVGYNDVSRFISVFKRLTGYTPLEFRRMYW